MNLQFIRWMQAQIRAAARHGPRVVVFEHATGDEGEWSSKTWRWMELDARQPRASARKGGLIKDWCSRRIARWHGPLKPVAFEPRIRNARVDRRHTSDFIHHVGWGRCGLRQTRRRHQRFDYLEVGSGPGDWRQGCPHSLNASFAVSERTVLLEETRAGKHHIGELRGFREKEVLDHEELETLEDLAS